MPFCRECGKGVEEDWVTCPFCSQPIGPPAAKVAEIRDSVVMGDVTINDVPSGCAQCGAVGSLQIPCKDCKELICCDHGSCKRNSQENLILDLKKGKMISCFSDEYSLPDIDREGVLRGRCTKCAIKIIKQKKDKFQHCSYCGMITAYNGVRSLWGDGEVQVSNEQHKHGLIEWGYWNNDDLTSLEVKHVVCSMICQEFLEQKNQIPESILQAWKDSELEYISGYKKPKDVFKPVKDVYAKRKSIRMDLMKYFGRNYSGFDAILIKKSGNIIDIMLPFGEGIDVNYLYRKGTYTKRKKIIFNLNEYNKTSSNYVLYDYVDLYPGYPDWNEDSHSLRNEMLTLYNEVNKKTDTFEIELINVRNKYGDGNKESNYNEIREFLEKYDASFGK